jgi:hypothetical protein
MNEQQKTLIQRLQKIEDFNLEFRRQKEEILRLLSDLKSQDNVLSNKVELLDKAEKRLVERADEKLKQIHSFESKITLIVSEKTKSFPWVVNAITDYLNLLDNKVAEFLETKKSAAPVTAHKIREIATEKKVLAQQLLIARYRIKYYESLFPFLVEFNDEDIDDLLIETVKRYETTDQEEDPIKQYLTSGEYENLTQSERNQKALDRYFASRKTPYQIGRDYERFIGYLYEAEGYQVKYQGISEGLEDLGRDLICKKGNTTEIVQCKCWSKNKFIHEKHINQLFGTTIKYFIDETKSKDLSLQMNELPNQIKNGTITPVFITSTKLSDTASDFASALGVTVRENISLERYPAIKCHTNKQTNEKIYHLPFDQMYDKTIIENKFGEFYAATVKEAEEKGFRRAWKWFGNKQ